MDKEEEKQRKQPARAFKRLNAMLTPMSKYYCSEMCNRVAYNTIQVLGGSGYMKDYAAERYLRDARITTIYEGTSQLQCVAAVRGVSSGSLETWAEPHEKKDYADPLLAELKQQLVEAKRQRRRSDHVHQVARGPPISIFPAGGWSIRPSPWSSATCCWTRARRRAEEARRPAIHPPRIAGGADELPSRFSPATSRRWKNTPCWPARCRRRSSGLSGWSLPMEDL